MPGKCSEVGCKPGYLNGPTSPRFRFPHSRVIKARQWFLPNHASHQKCVFSILMNLSLYGKVYQKGF